MTLGFMVAMGKRLTISCLILSRACRQLPLFNNRTNQDLSLLYNVIAFPTKVIIGKKGELLGIFRGENEAFYNALDNLAKDLIFGN